MVSKKSGGNPPANAAKPKPSELGTEFGVAASFPVTTFESFSFGQTGTSSGVFLLGNRANSVPVDKLIEMRRRDSMTRMLLRMFILPILSCAADGEWVSPDDVKGAEKEVEFANLMFRLPPYAGGMSASLNLVLRQTLLALVEGFSVFEEVRVVPDHGPLKGKITLRKMAHRDSSTIRFLVDEHGGFNGVVQKATYPDGTTREQVVPRDKVLFYTCFTGDTEVSLLDGTEVPISEVVRRVQSGEELWSYSVKDGRVVPGRITHGQSMGVRSLVAVTLDNGEVVRCTPEHRWMLRDGSYKAAEDLVEGDALMPLYRRSQGLGRASKQYEQVYHPGAGGWQFTHRAVSDFLYGPCESGQLTHHKDVNAFNNAPNNLQRVTFEEHRQIHADMSAACSKVMKAKWSDPNWRAKQISVLNSPEYVAKQRAAHTSERRAATGERMRAWMLENAPHTRRDVTVELIADVAREQFGLAETAAVLGVHPDTVLSRIRESGKAQSWAEFSDLLGIATPVRLSGSVVFDYLTSEVEDEVRSADGGWVRVGFVESYREQQTIRKWFLTNPAYGLKYKFRRGEFFVAAAEARAPQYLNHKVVSVERLGDQAQEEVFDITVEDHHNFALSAGVFVHNCQPEENAMYGVSMFESAWYNYDTKSKLYYVAHVAAQMAAVPGRIGTYPMGASPSQVNAFKKALSEFAFNTSLTVPQGWNVSPFSSAGQFNFLEYINHHSQQQAKSVLLQFADSDQRLAVIENGGADASADFFLQALESIMDDIAEVWSIHLMPKYIDWNFGSGKYPIWRFGRISDSARDTIKEVFTSIVTSSVLNCTPEFMRQSEEKLAKRLGYDIDYTAVREREEQAAEQQAQLAEAQAQQEATPTEGVEPTVAPEGDADPQASGDAAPLQMSDQLQHSIDGLVEMAQNLFLSADGPDPEFDRE